MNFVVQNDNLNLNNKIEIAYANVVFQALISLNTTKSDFLNDEPLPMMNTPLTNDFKVLLYGIFNTPNNPFFSNLMKTYYYYAQEDTNALLKNPYNFLKYFIVYLNTENNKVINHNYFQIYEQQKKNNMYNMYQSFNTFKEYCKYTQNSIISKCFYYSEMTNIICYNCNSKTFNCSLNPILEIDLDRYMQYKKIRDNSKISLNECLNYYFNLKSPAICINCQNNNAHMFKMMLNDSKVLIIHLNRNIHNGNNDINIDINIDISKFFNKINNMKFYTKYELKSYICFDGNGYLVDYCINKNYKSRNWYRFNNEYRKIQENELFCYEPILLFYETIEEKQLFLKNNEAIYSNNRNKSYIKMNNINNSYNYSMNQLNNQMCQLNLNPINNNNMNNFNQMNNMNYLNNINKMNNINQMNNINMINNFVINNQMYLNPNMNKIQMPNIIQNSANNIQYSNLSNNFNNKESNINCNNKENDNNISVLFIIVSEENPEDKISKIKIQIKTEEKINEIIKKFFIKIQKEESFIKKFIFNDNELSKESTKTVEESNIINNSIIKAIKTNSMDNNNINIKNIENNNYLNSNINDANENISNNNDININISHNNDNANNNNDLNNNNLGTVIFNNANNSINNNNEIEDEEEEEEESDEEGGNEDGI